MTFTSAGFLTSIADGTEAVTVTLERAAGNSSVSIAHALRGPLTRRLAALSTGLQLEGDETVFQIDVSELGNGNIIRTGDRITDAAGVIFLVQTAALTCMQTRWECVCSNKR